MYTRSTAVLLGLMFVALLGASGGCSFSKSSESSVKSSGSVSRSASSPLESSSYSSMTEEQRFEVDVKDHTARFVQSSGGDVEGFRKKVGEFASKHGIADWENNRTTFLAIGRGLKQASLGQPQVEAFTKLLGEGDAQKMGWISDGFTGNY